MYSLWGERMPLHCSWGSDSWGGPCPSSSQEVSGSRPITVSLNGCGGRAGYVRMGRGNGTTVRGRCLRQCSVLGWVHAKLCTDRASLSGCTRRGTWRGTCLGWAHLFIFGSFGNISDDSPILLPSWRDIQALPVWAAPLPEAPATGFSRHGTDGVLTPGTCHRGSVPCCCCAKRLCAGGQVRRAPRAAAVLGCSAVLATCVMHLPGAFSSLEPHSMSAAYLSTCPDR